MWVLLWQFDPKCSDMTCTRKMKIAISVTKINADTMEWQHQIFLSHNGQLRQKEHSNSLFLVVPSQTRIFDSILQFNSVLFPYHAPFVLTTGYDSELWWTVEIVYALKIDLSLVMNPSCNRTALSCFRNWNFIGNKISKSILLCRKSRTVHRCYIRLIPY
jgi:hypothetical protein